MLRRERSTRTGLGLLLAIALLLAAALPSSAAAQASPQPLGPWDGTNPFECVNQDVGSGTDFPFPDADPFCVEFDKTSQNVTDFGIVDFAAEEPTRVTAAGSKCFYYQRDHWRGSVVQGAEPELWNWDGSYFFDRAKGVGGVHVTNFRIGGSPMDATPYVPPAYRPYTEKTGGGGVIVLLESDPDPTCGAKVDTPSEREEIYASEPRSRDCIAPGGQIAGRRVGRARLGMSPSKLHERLGPPRKRKTFVQRWCVVGGSSLRVAFHKRERAGNERGAPRGVSLIRTDNPGHSVRGIGAGSKRKRAIDRLDLERLTKIGAVTVWAAEPRRRYRLLVGTRGKRVRWLAIADPNRLPSRKRMRTALGNSR